MQRAEKWGLGQSAKPQDTGPPLECAKCSGATVAYPFDLTGFFLKIFNSLTRQKEEFVPLEPGHVRLYVCGMTVYDFCHIGHARVMVAFDVVRRVLEAEGLRVTYVRNITDIDDKIIRRAVENNETIRSLTDRFIAAMHEDAAALGVLPPTHEPRATEFVPQMLDLVQRLQANGLAYQDPAADGEPGDVHFSVRGFPGYGRLSGKSLDELRAGERVEVVRDKRDPLDFVLWKRAKPGEPEEATWTSAYGAGRPGWHLECSAMSCSLLGPHFDLHGGGADLQFPHHENEIAQSEGAYPSPAGEPFVRIWMHNGFVRIDEEKMSKSLGNFFTIRDVLKSIPAEVLRFFILRAHYRSPLNYSPSGLDDAAQGLDRLYGALEAAGLSAALDAESTQALVRSAWASSHPAAVEFRRALRDDFNTPEAVASLFGLASEVYKAAGTLDDAAELGQLLRGLGLSIGLLADDASARRRQGVDEDEASSIDALVAERLQAKKTKDFARADAIRAELTARGIVLEDGPTGTRWHRA